MAAAIDLADRSPEPSKLTSRVVTCFRFSTLSRLRDASALAACSCARCEPCASRAMSDETAPCWANDTLLSAWWSARTQIAPAHSDLTSMLFECLMRTTIDTMAPSSATVVWLAGFSRAISATARADIAWASRPLSSEISAPSVGSAPISAMESWFSRLNLASWARALAACDCACTLRLVSIASSGLMPPAFAIFACVPAFSRASSATAAAA